MSLIDSSNGAGGRAAQRAAGERSEAAAGRAERAGAPDPELVERPRRRRFTAEYKLAIVREADACSRPGEIGALLRREGLYSSLLTGGRRAHPLESENLELRRRAERAEAELDKAKRVIEVQGNVSALLGELLEPRGATTSTER